MAISADKLVPASEHERQDLHDDLSHLAGSFIRSWHALWFLGRDRKELANLPENQRGDLARQGWLAARSVGEPGSGTDFLGLMNWYLTLREKGLYRRDQYGPIDQDVWSLPVPVLWTGAADAIRESKSDYWFRYYSDLAIRRYRNDNWLRHQALDDLGRELENGIFRWLLLRLTEEPWLRLYSGQDLSDQDESDPRNDFSGAYFSNYLNPAYQKVAMWIQDVVDRWSRLNEIYPDWSNTWRGPSVLHLFSTGERILEGRVQRNVEGLRRRIVGYLVHWSAPG
jgi:hypothetical protein